MCMCDSQGICNVVQIRMLHRFKGLKDIPIDNELF